MKVALLADSGNADGTLGGAELTMREFADAAPKRIQLIEEVDRADVVVLGNCVQLPPETVRELEGRRVVRYHHDLARHEHPDLRDWLDEHAQHVFTSPYHQTLYGLNGQQWPNVPPALRLGQFRNGRTKAERAGAVAIAPWQNPGKGQVLLREWADQHEPVDVYGPGPFQPEGQRLTVYGPLPHREIPATLRRYQTFVHLPTEPEPFGRAVVEAWAAGCQLVVNRLVGAVHYLQHDPAALETAAADFWAVVCD